VLVGTIAVPAVGGPAAPELATNRVTKEKK